MAKGRPARTVILPLLAALVAACFVLAFVAWVAGGTIGGYGTAVVALLCGGLALAAIIVGSRAVLPVAAGPLGFVLELDPLAALFILPVCVAAAACGLYGAADQVVAPILTPVITGALLLALLAGDGLTLVLGLSLAWLAAWCMLGERSATSVATLVGGGLGLVVAMALLSAGLDVSFAAMRAAPLDGWRAGALLLSVVAGAGLQLGYGALPASQPVTSQPGHAQPGHAQPGHAQPATALVWAGSTAASVYVLVRVLFDLAGPVTPQWWCAAPLLVGASWLVTGAYQANRADRMDGVLAACAAGQAGFAMIGVGLALAARGADLAPLQAAALAGALLHVLNLGVFQTLAFLAAAAAERGAGSGVLDRLGGLIHQAPITTGCLLVAAASLAVLPPSAGFASVWMLFQAVVAAPRIGGFALQCLLTGVLAVMALAVALLAAAMLRLVGVAFLGRPRTPRAAAAEEAPLLTRCVLIGLAGITVTLGVFPAAALHLLPIERQGDWLGIAAPSDAPGYLPLALLGLAVAAMTAMGLLGRQLRLAKPRLVAPWAYGFTPPPAWLPFGDPATQYTAGSLTLPAPEALRWPRLTTLVEQALRLATRLATQGERADTGALLVAMAALLALSLVALAGWAAA